MLFIVLIILAAGITRFYLNVPSNTADKSSQTEIVRKLSGDGSGHFIFCGSDGKYGITDSDDRISAAPEWDSLRFAEDGLCIASSHFGKDKLFGCIDCEGNAVIPFIYSSVEQLGSGDHVLYKAQSASDGSIVLYDSSFSPCFRNVWEKCSAKDSTLTLSDKVGTYTFSAAGDSLIFTGASVSGKVLNCAYTADISSKVLLAKLNVPMLENMTDCAGKYIDYAFSGNDDILSEITSGSRSGFSPLFPDDHKLLSKKLMGISDVHIYSIRSQNGTPCYEVSFSADTEVSYSDESGSPKTLRGKYRGSVGFSGWSEHDLRAVSGKFENVSPDYPKPEPADDAENKDQSA